MSWKHGGRINLVLPPSRFKVLPDVRNSAESLASIKIYEIPIFYYLNRPRKRQTSNFK